jgi:peptidoglycan/xylan/chitin deacetylase (PgdA/CDA1 family)
MAAGIRKQLKSVLDRVAGLTGAYERRFRLQMTIVAFHRVNDRLVGDPLTCSAAKFEAFCNFFLTHFSVLPLSEQVAGARAGKDLGGTLSITFDDGYFDNSEVAAPILRRLQLPATFLVTTGFIGSQITPPWDRNLPEQPGWMSWDDVRALHSEGFEIGCHTDSHLDMGKTDAETVRAELALSKQKLLDALRTSSVQLFAYPFGGPEHISQRSRELVREAGFTCCLSCHGGINAVRPDPFDLNRIAVDQWYTNPNVFAFEMLAGPPPACSAADSRGGQMSLSSGSR